jgi:hypothetical protein
MAHQDNMNIMLESKQAEGEGWGGKTMWQKSVGLGLRGTPSSKLVPLSHSHWAGAVIVELG